MTIDLLIEEIKSIMPSSWFWPFTILRLESKDFKGITFNNQALSAYLLLFLIRTDFTKADARDFLLNSEELSYLSSDLHSDLVDDMLIKINNDQALNFWKEKITNMCIGIAVQVFRKMNIDLGSICHDPQEMDRAFSYINRDLRSYQLFDIQFKNF